MRVFVVRTFSSLSLSLYVCGSYVHTFPEEDCWQILDTKKLTCCVWERFLAIQFQTTLTATHHLFCWCFVDVCHTHTFIVYKHNSLSPLWVMYVRTGSGSFLSFHWWERFRGVPYHAESTLSSAHSSAQIFSTLTLPKVFVCHFCRAPARLNSPGAINK